MWYRALGVPSYGVSPSFIKDSDEFAHGRNERVPLLNVRPAAQRAPRSDLLSQRVDRSRFEISGSRALIREHR